MKLRRLLPRRLRRRGRTRLYSYVPPPPELLERLAQAREDELAAHARGPRFRPGTTGGPVERKRADATGGPLRENGAADSLLERIATLKGQLAALTSELDSRSATNAPDEASPAERRPLPPQPSD